MPKTKSLRCTYQEHATRNVSSNWLTICKDHEDELPGIRDFVPGTFNLTLRDRTEYAPPGELELRNEAKMRGHSDGNHISKHAKVVALNEQKVEAWLYRGGHGNTSIELLSKVRLKEFLHLSDRAEVIAAIEET